MKLRVNLSSFSRLSPLLFLMLLSLNAFSFSCMQPEKEWVEQMADAERSTVLLNNSSGTIPLADLANRKIASLNLGSPYAAAFDSVMSRYAAIARFTSEGYPSERLNELGALLKFYNTVVIQIPGPALADSIKRNFITELAKSRQVLAVVSGDPANLRYLEGAAFPVISCLRSSAVASGFSAQLIFGGVAASARLGADVSASYKRGDGYSTKVVRLRYSVPEDAGIDSRNLKEIDDIVAEAIRTHATPGAVVLVAKDGKVIFEKAYGSHTYGGQYVTKASDIFDLASVSKITATTIAAMRLYEQDKLRLDTPISTYFPLSANTNKSSLTVRELMLHEGGLVPYIPFHNVIRPSDFSRDSSDLYSVKVADNFYLRKGYYEEVMLPRMLASGLRQRGKYEYSDLSMYFMKEIVEYLSSERLDQYVEEQFYAPLGMYTAGYKPRLRFDKSRIAPTENDTYFRKSLLQGYVHDQGAALAGGVAGHAGVFATANDMAILFQMLLNGGTYGGTQYFQPATVSLFTSRQSKVSRRGLGFDRWDPNRSTHYPSDLASPETYGHTGFTGTCVWVDPKYNLIYVFLSNRLNDQPANKLSSMRIRGRIQDVIYRAIQRNL